MSQIRRDALRDRAVLMARARADRPRYWRAVPPERTGEPCPFCPGHERLTPPAILERPPGVSRPSSAWTIRVIPNKYPAVAEPAGVHEVIVESDDHDARLATMPAGALEGFLDVLHERVEHHRARGRIVIAFKNHGEPAGATIEHPHTQIVALEEPPSHLARTVATAWETWRADGVCADCTDTRREIRAGERVVVATGSVVAFCPFVSRFPYEVRVSRIEHAPAPGLAELAHVLGDVARRTERLLGPVAHNVTWSFPPDPESERVVHPILETWPRLGRLAGFEIASGMTINPVTPETAAEELRASDR